MQLNRLIGCKAVFRKLRPELLFLAGFLLHLAVMYPGFLCYDAVNQILEARAGEYSDWHPPLMAMIWHLSEKIITGPAGMLALQLGLLWFGLALIYRAYFNAIAGVAAGLFLLPFLPPVFGISGAILKDMLMCGALLTALGLVGLIDRGQGRPWLMFSAGMLSLWLAMLLRHNALFAIIPLLAFALHRLFPRQHFWGWVRVFALSTLLAVAGFVGTGLINQRLADRHTNPWVANAVFDVAGVIKRLEEPAAQQVLFDQLRGFLGSPGTLQRFLLAYNDQYWRGVYESLPPNLLLPEKAFGPKLHGFESLPPNQLQGLKSLWLGVVLEHPRLWLAHRLATSAFIIGTVPKTHWSPVIMAEEFPFDLAAAYGSTPNAGRLQSWIEQTLLDHVDTWFFKAWIYLLLVVGLLLHALVRRQALLFCLSLSALMHELGLLLAAPSPDFRYSHYMIVSSLLGLLFLWHSRRSPKS